MTTGKRSKSFRAVNTLFVECRQGDALDGSIEKTISVDISSLRHIVSTDETDGETPTKNHYFKNTDTDRLYLLRLYDDGSWIITHED